MLKGIQQQSLFPQLINGDVENRKFIDSCNQLDSSIVISARDGRLPYQGYTLLHMAAALGCSGAVTHLIGLGHIIDCIDTSVSRVTPLMLAIKENQIETTDILVKAGASLYQADIRGESSLHYGARRGMIICKVLLSSREMGAIDYRLLLGTKNIKLKLPEEVAVSPFIANMFKSIRETGSFEPLKRMHKKHRKKHDE